MNLRWARITSTTKKFTKIIALGKDLDEEERSFLRKPKSQPAYFPVASGWYSSSYKQGCSPLMGLLEENRGAAGTDRPELCMVLKDSGGIFAFLDGFPGHRGGSPAPNT